MGEKPGTLANQLESQVGQHISPITVTTAIRTAVYIFCWFRNGDNCTYIVTIVTIESIMNVYIVNWASFP